MVRGVNARTAQLRAERVAATEQRLVDAAARLFVRDGYVATTLQAVAEEAGVAPRTVYLRFGTKAALLKRTVDVALVGDTDPIDVAHREWTLQAQTAPTLEQRIRLDARNIRDMMARIGPLLLVAEQAAALEPDVAAAFQAGREATRDQMRQVWTSLAEDGFLPGDADVQWLTDTAVMTCSADTYLHAHRTLGWTADAYARWVEITWHRMIAASTTPRPGEEEPKVQRASRGRSAGGAASRQRHNRAR